MRNEIIKLAEYIYNSQPFNKKDEITDTMQKISVISKKDRIELLCFSFIRYDTQYNYNLCLSITNLWSDFEVKDWKYLIIKMFPRNVKYEARNLRQLNTGCYFDITLINGIIGVSPFKFIFNSQQISNEEKENFHQYLCHYGQTFFFNKERELIENAVHFYGLNIFQILVTQKEKIVRDQEFSEWYSHESACELFKS